MSLTVSRERDRRFYTIMGLAVSAIVLIGFSRTYYLRAWFPAPPLSLRLHLHGLVLTLWLGLFLVQAKLIEAGRRSLHKKLGVAGVILAALVITTTYAAAVETARLGLNRGGITSVDRLFSSVMLLSQFGVLVVMGAAFRKRPEIHKRFMLLAMIAVVGPGANRAIAILLGHGVRDFHIPVMSTLVLVGLLYDWRTRSRPHWVLLWGGAVLIASQLTRRLIGGSELWAQIGTWLIG